MRNEALINPEILTWARSRANLTLEEMSAKLKKDSTTIKDWEKGIKKPTFNQALEIAKKLLIPFGYLFLNKIPNEQVELPDFRAFSPDRRDSYSPEFIETYNNVLLLQEWYRSYLRQQEVKKINYIGKFSETSSPKEVAHFIIDLIGINSLKYGKTVSDYRRLLVKNFEHNGIIVMLNSKVGNNNTRSLDINEFRAFAVVDDHAPFIFINASDTIKGQIFSLIHELVHVLIGKSGISDLNSNPNYTIENKVEVFCNKVAGMVLAPSDILNSAYQNNSEITFDVIDTLGNKLKVSNYVIIRRMRDLSLIDDKSYTQFNKEALKRFNEFKSNNKNKSSQGSFNNTFRARFSHKLTKSIFNSTKYSETTYSEAASLLKIKSSTVSSYVKKLNY